jgi:hypothetical protein
MFSEPNQSLEGIAPSLQNGHRRGLVIDKAYKLNNDLQSKGIHSIYAWLVDYPRSTPTTPGVAGVLIATRKRNDYLVHLADRKPLE